MADIFVSYAREDRSKASSFVALLEAQGWTVWWDREINPGLSFTKVIERGISSAKCVIVLWSSKSISSTWVHAEAINKPIVDITAIRKGGFTWQYPATGLALLLVILVGYILLDKSFFLDPAKQTDIPTTSASPIAEPIASIAVLPFADMEYDISIEVAELLSSAPAIHIVAYD